MKHSVKRYLITLLAPLALLLLVALALNHVADAWWVRSKFDSWNLYQPVVDERRQKAMHIKYALGPQMSDSALIVGTSRSTYYPPDAFGAGQAFNFGLSALAVEDYDEVIRFYNLYRPKPERIYVMMDLLGVSKAEAARRVPFAQYIREIDTPFYRARLAMSWDTLTNSIDVIKLNRSKKSRKRERTYYIGAREKYLNVADDKERKALYEKYFREEVPTRYGDEFRYRDDFVSLLEDIKAAAEGAELVVILTPVQDQLSKRVMEHGRYADYSRWLSDMVKEFGQVYDAFSPTSFTADEKNFRDSHHAYPEQCRLIMKDVLAGGGMNAVKVNEQNLEEHLDRAEKAWAAMSAEK